MKRTSPAFLLLLALVGGGVGFAINHALTISGRHTFTPSAFLPVVLILLAAGVLGIAWPVRRSIRGITPGRIDPFRALRAAVLARASSLLGALMTGFGLGLLVFLLSRPINPPVGSTVTLVALAVSAIVLVVAALVAEDFCTLPKDPDDREPEEPDRGVEHGH